MTNLLFWSTQSRSMREKYTRYLQSIGALSRLFSDTNIPYLYYRNMERCFCLAFNYEDLSRTDIAIDVKHGDLGIGLKTYLRSSSQQKIAEFNDAKPQFKNQDPASMVHKIAELRNQRILFASRTHNLSRMIYHCLLRDKNGFHILEEPMDFISLEKICGIKKKETGISFHDDKHQYNFNFSKSTLFKTFEEQTNLFQFNVNILENPFDLLAGLLNEVTPLWTRQQYQTVYLPLYNPRGKTVESRSGLNQGMALGRKRHPDELYIPIPSWIHKKYPTFFPPRHSQFCLILPNGNVLNAKICQSGEKALMSDPNKALGKWILRDVLQIPYGKPVTMKDLNIVGIDSVRVDKINDSEFEINFAQTGSYSEFEEQIL